VAFGHVAGVQLPWWVLVLIPAGVWSVYVADRLLDAKSGLSSAQLEMLRDRHMFHWHHRRLLVPAATAAALGCAWIVFHWMPRVVREHDSLLAAASLLYFTRVHAGRKLFPLLSKEFLVGMLFTAGCAMPAWTRGYSLQLFPVWPFMISVVLFALLAWLNCYAIDRWEAGESAYVRRPFALFALPLAVAFILCGIALAAAQPFVAGLLFCGTFTTSLLGILDRVRNRLTPVTLRAAADFVLLTPLAQLVIVSVFRK
jgi:hypothetical protein